MINKIPHIVITAGDPDGIGYDLLLKLAYKSFACKITVLACKKTVLNRAKQSKKKIHIATGLVQHRGKGSLSVIDYPRHKVQKIPIELLTIGDAILGCESSQYDALVTLPVNKEKLNNKIRFIGHTEYLAKKLNVKNPIMGFFEDNIITCLNSTHVSLKKAIQMVRKETICKNIHSINAELKKRFGIKNPKILITGLNPHASENGQFGNEEKKEIIPAINQLIKEKINVFGPCPGDTAFIKKNRDQFDCIYFMYHDQALSAFKALYFDSGVNVTFGLPIIRTSVDHGTSEDLVGQISKINPLSFFNAIKLAIKLCKTK